MKTLIVIMIAVFFVSTRIVEVHAATCRPSMSERRYTLCIIKSQIKAYIQDAIKQVQAAGRKEDPGGRFQAYCDMIRQHIDLEEAAHFVGEAFWDRISQLQRDRLMATIHAHLASLMEEVFQPLSNDRIAVKYFTFNIDDTQFVVPVAFWSAEAQYDLTRAGHFQYLITVTLNKISSEPWSSETEPQFLMTGLSIPFLFNTRSYLQKSYTSNFNNSKATSLSGKFDDVITEVMSTTQYKCE